MTRTPRTEDTPRLLRTEAEILAAGAAAVADWPPLTERQIDLIVALLSPVAAEVQAIQRENR
ncbi:hypothetical protein [Micromonospora sp. NPDC005413]|uniref:hypothetical protein n=1 Tax=Micromonospora sp. NPDC005413 TaxID=3154563 RepID=UPI0033AC9288